MALPQWKTDLINTALSSSILSFGSFTLKSGRVSPYFMNCGLFSSGPAISAIASAYARTLDDYATAHPDFDFDILFGPAYKGIPLCATTALSLVQLGGGSSSSSSSGGRWSRIGYSFNRKEAKDHGEGGTMIGESLRGKKVVIIDDVITAGTAIREAMGIIAAQGGELAGIVVAVDRQEKMPSAAEKEGKGDDGLPRGSAIGEVRRETGVPVLAVLTLEDVIEGMKALGRGDDVGRMEEYRKQYGASD